MALFDTQGLNSISSNVGGRAVKSADIYVRSNTGSNGQVNDPNVYTNAMAQLQPYSDNQNVQLKMAEYANLQKALQAKGADQNMTLARFRQSLDGAIFAKGDQNRDPYTLARNTADLLNGALYTLDQHIKDLESQNKSVDTLLAYRSTLAQAAQQQTSLVNGIVNGTVNPSQDGFGYYVKTNPADGKLLGVALLPADVSNLTETTKNMSRLSTTANLGTGTVSTSIPVYMTSTVDSSGEKQAILGTTASGKQQVWTGTGSTPLSNTSSNNSDTLDLASNDARTAYPFQPNTTLNPGQIGKTISGVDDQGNPQYTYFYRGKDNSLNAITDPSVIQQMQKDPVLGNSANNPIDLSADDVKSMGTTTPWGLQQLQAFDASAASAPAPQAPAAPAQPGFFSNAAHDILGAAGAVEHGVANAAGAVSGFFSKFLGNKNRPTSLQTPAESVNGQPSAPDVVDKGKSYFASSPSTLPPIA